MPFLPAQHVTTPPTTTTAAITRYDPVQRYHSLDTVTTSPRREVVKVTSRGVISASPGTKGTTHLAVAPAATRRAQPRANRSYARPPLDVDLGVLRVTKYCSTGNRTASGTWPAIGDAATLDRTIPFGTELHIIGDITTGRHIDQTFTVTDRIGHGSDIDLYAGGENDPTCEPRVDHDWGTQHLDVHERP